MRRYVGTLTSTSTALTVTLNDNEDVEVLLVQGTGGNKTVTWTGINVWLTPSGVAPTLFGTIAGQADTLQFWRIGATTYGIHVGDTGVAGATGGPGRAGVVWKRQFANGLPYNQGDGVYFNGSSYIALSAVPAGKQPDLNLGTFWDLWAAGSVTAAPSGTTDIFDRTTTAPSLAGGTITYTRITAVPSGSGAGASCTGAACRSAETSNLENWYRAETDIGDINHFCECTIATAVVTSTYPGYHVALATRFDATNPWFYGLVLLENYVDPVQAGFQIYKYSATSPATVTTLAVEQHPLIALPKAGDKMKFVVSGTTTTTLTGYYNTGSGYVQVVTITDTTSPLTTGTRSGFELSRGVPASDLAINRFAMGAGQGPSS